MADKDVACNQPQEERNKSLRNEQQLLIQEIRNVQSDMKNHNDDAVKKKEVDLSLALNIPRQSRAETLPGAQLKVSVDAMHTQLTSGDSSFLHASAELSDREVLQNASGGLALNGVYISSKAEYDVQTRGKLLRLPESFHLDGPVHQSIMKNNESSSLQDESDFIKDIRKKDCSGGMSQRLSVPCIGAEISVQLGRTSASDKQQQSASTCSYFSTTNYMYMPTASGCFEMNQLRLAEGAVKELKSIEDILAHTSDYNRDKILESKFLNFFSTFGSHANQGRIHFGGIYLWKASAEGVNSDQLKEVKKIISDALSISVGISSGGTNSATGGLFTVSNLRSELSGKYNNTLVSLLQISLEKTGGPPEMYSLSGWKAGVVANKKTWSIIDRDVKLVAVWDIIASNHKTDFRDALKFREDILEAYSRLTHQFAKVPYGEYVASAISEAQSLMQEFTHGDESESYNKLLKLVNLKQKWNENTQNNETWIKACLSHPILQEYLSKIVSNNKKSSNDQTEIIRMLMHSILHPYIYDVENFPEQSSIMQWVYDSKEKEAIVHESDIYSFNKTMADTKTNLDDAATHSSEKLMHDAKVKATRDVAVSLNAFCQALKESKQVEEQLLVIYIAAAAGYSAKNKMFQKLLDSDEIDFLQQKIESSLKTFSNLKDQDPGRAQAFVLVNALTVSASGNEVTSVKKDEIFRHLKSHMEDTMSPEVLELLESYSERPIRWKLLETNLNYFVSGNYQTNSDHSLAQTGIHEMEKCCQGTKNVSGHEGKTRPCDAQPISFETPRAKQFQNLLERLGLAECYRNKIKTADIFTVNNSMPHEKYPRREEELAFCYLQKLCMIDYQVRFVTCREESNKTDGAVQSPDLIKDSETTFDDFFSDDSELCNEEETDNRTNIHPMDLQMVIWHCADHILRSYITTNLTFCQFAVPLLCPNPHTNEIEFPLWSLSHIIKSWRTVVTTEKKTSKRNRIINTDTPLVSVMRFNNVSKSKSQWLNSLLSKQNHDIFFHRNCRGGTNNAHLMRGAVEVAWYCPGGRDDDIFNDCIAFTNLHGDAREHVQQMHLLQEISSINVVVLSDSNQDNEGKKLLQRLYQSTKPFICLFTDKENVGKSSATKIKIAAKNKNDSELIDELKSHLKRLLLITNETCRIDSCSELARKHGFTVDEDQAECKEGKSLAQTVYCLIKETDLSQVKDTFFPLQGKLWHDWCKKDKGLTRFKVSKTQSIEEYRSNIEEEKLLIRKAQYEKAFPLNDVMRFLIQILTSQPHTVKQYFLHSLTMYLNDLSSDILSELHQKYSETWTRLRECKQRGDDTVHVLKIQAELNRLSQKLDASSFGIDNFFREVAQIYEASEKLPTTAKHFASLPDMAADMIISGFPLELLDGDASHVPLTWISSVLDKVIEKKGDNKLFVLSTLGIQSSGKSTLLNAMFGLQFPVGAGRCTRGAYMQLVKVEEKFSKELGCDFVLVVDTEGLRAPELSNVTPTRDNELATFVIGLGNVTVINIFGENPSEMKDVLQIAVQAFLRMRQVKLSPSCVFVHQNVGDVTVQERVMDGRRRFQDMLDEMTRMAAEQEQCQVATFDEVIAFDVDSHIRYFDHLWEGNPPMAPPNPSYSLNVKELKELLLGGNKRKRKVNALKISELQLRIQDLWRALLAENFVFSFKNTLEVAAYSKLEDMYGTWTWKLRSHAHELENELLNSSDNSTSQFESKLLKTYNEINEEMENYFSREDTSELLSQWKGKFESKLNVLKKDLVFDVQNNHKEWKRHKSILDTNRSRYETQIVRKSKDLASKLRGNAANEKYLVQLFDEMWVEECCVIGNSGPSVDIDIRADVEHALSEMFQKQSQLLMSKLLDFKKKTFKYYSTYIIMNTQYTSSNSSLGSEDLVEMLTNEIINKATHYIEGKEKTKSKYNRMYTYDILTQMTHDIKTFEHSNPGIKFTDEYRVDLALHILAEAVARFNKMHEAFQKEHSPLIYLNSKRGEYFNSFKYRCQGATKTTIFADSLCNKLKGAIQHAVWDKACLNIARKMKCDHEALNGNRSKLEHCILIDLAEKDNFANFDEYIHNAKCYCFKYIIDCIEKYCSENESKRLRDALQCCLEHYGLVAVSAIEKATHVARDKNSDILSWLDTFCKELDGKIKFSQQDLEYTEYKEIEDIGFFNDETIKTLVKTMEGLRNQYSSATTKDLKNARKTLHDILFQQLSGCWQQCPSCNVTCTHTVPNHDGDHSVQFHRPTAVRGGYWNNTNHFVTDICTSLVDSDVCLVLEDKRIPWKTYRDAGGEYSRWSITPSRDPQPFWKWFVCRFKSNLEERYNMKFEGLGKIPHQWERIQKDDVIEHLKKC